MLVYSLRAAGLPFSIAAGATLGQEHMKHLRARLGGEGRGPGVGRVVVLDYSGIDNATSSYVKATALWLLRCGQLAAGVGVDQPAGEPGGPVALDVYPLVAGLSPDVADEIDEVFGGRKLP